MDNMKQKIDAHNKISSYLYSVFSLFVIIITCILLIFTFFFRLVQVSGDSMYPNVYNNDKIIVSNFLYTPDYGDIIAIGRSTETESSIIKRVIALPGDEININFKSHIITVNGDVITENYPVDGAISVTGDVEFPVTVPDNCIFVLGDNRNNSVDSRFSQVGFISLDEIAGKALFRAIPFGTFVNYK